MLRRRFARAGALKRRLIVSGWTALEFDSGLNDNCWTMIPAFGAPMINLYSRDLSRAAAFYSELGFVETFRTPESGEPVHIELKLDGFTLGIATMEAAKEHHSLQPGGDGRW